MGTAGNIISKLNIILKSNYTSEFAYLKAVELVENSHLKEFFKAYAKRRYRYGHDIMGEIKRLGGERDQNTTKKNDIELFWMKLKTAIASNSEVTILEECRKIEMEAWENYNYALSTHKMDIETKIILDEHKSNINEALYQIMELKEQQQAVKKY